MHVIACNGIYYIVLQIHYMSLHRGVLLMVYFDDDAAVEANDSVVTEPADSESVMKNSRRRPGPLLRLGTVSSDSVRTRHCDLAP